MVHFNYLGGGGTDHLDCPRGSGTIGTWQTLLPDTNGKLNGMLVKL